MKTARLVFYLCFLLVFTWLAYPAGPRLQSQGILEKVSIERLTDRLEITLQLTQKTNFNSFSLTGPNRLVIDLFQTERFSSSPRIEVNAFGVQKIRTAINRPGVIRVVFDLQDQVPHHKIGEEGNSIKIELWYELKAEQVEPETVVVKKEEKEELEEKKEAEKEAQKIEVVKKEEEKKEVEKLEEEKVEAKVEEPEVLPEIPVTEEVSELPSSRGWRLGFGLHGGYYIFQSSELKDYFGKGTSFTGGEVGVEFPLGRMNAIGFLGSFKFIRSDGQGDYQGTKAKFSNSPVSFTLLFLREIGKLLPFAGIGLDYNYYRLTYPEGHDADSSSGVVWGGNLQVGTNFLLSRKFRIKIVYHYHFATASEGDFDVVLNGSGVIVSLSFWFGR